MMLSHHVRSAFRSNGSLMRVTMNRRYLSNDNKTVMNQLINTDGSKVAHKFYHSSAYILAICTPIAFFLSPSPYNMPIDISLGVLFPMHSHVAINCIISDYVPKAMQMTARMGLFGVTAISILGLLKLNIAGAGMTETIKSLWRRKETKTK